jgi:hypothetical protein
LVNFSSSSLLDSPQPKHFSVRFRDWPEICIDPPTFKSPHLATMTVISFQTVPKEGACMVLFSLPLCSLLELLVVLFQVFGVTALCLNRLLPATSTRWVSRGRAGFVFALVGLGLTGAVCARNDSVFALIAGGTMTLLLIGMTVGNGHGESLANPCGRVATEPNLAS